MGGFADGQWPPLQVRCEFTARLVGVDVPIDPSAQAAWQRRRHEGMPPYGKFGNVGVGAHCICAREGTCEIAGTGGYLIRPYRVVRICGAPCRGRCPHRPAGISGHVGVGAACMAARGQLRFPAIFPTTSCGTGGHEGRPYGHARGFFVGAGFIPARTIFCSRPRPAHRSGYFPRFRRGL